MQNGKFGSYVCARAGPVAETDTIANIAKAKRRIETFLIIHGTAPAHATTAAMLIPVNSRSRRTRCGAGLTEFGGSHSVPPRL